MIRYLRTVIAEDRSAAGWVIAAVVVHLFAIGWDLPGAWGWENDGIAPRDFVAGVANNLAWGSGHRYPLLHNLIVAIPCLPALIMAVASAESMDFTSVRAALLTPGLMTYCSVVIKLVSVGFAALTYLVLARIARRLFGAAAGRWTVLVVATNLSCAYYGRVSNLDGPYMMWTVLAMDRLLNTAETGERRDYALFMLFAAAAVATKDQAYAAFILLVPIYLVIVPWQRASLVATVRGAFIGALGYGVMSAALFNPVGFWHRVKTLSGPNAQDWRLYPRTFEGAMQNIVDVFWSQPTFWWPWPMVIAAWLGVLWVLLGPQQTERGATDDEALRRHEDGDFRPRGSGLGLSPRVNVRLWQLAPWVAALSSFIGFTLVVGRTEHRFLLPQAFWLSIYAGVLFSRLPRFVGPRAATAVAAVIVAFAAVPPLALMATQLKDPRWTVTRWLADRPEGTVVEIYGKVVYLPHLDMTENSPYRVQRVLRRPVKRRNPVIGAQEIEGSAADVQARSPDVLVVPESWARRYLPTQLQPGQIATKIAARAQADTADRDFYRAVVADKVPGYRRALLADVEWPAFLTKLGIHPVAIHGSTARRLWVLTRASSP